MHEIVNEMIAYAGETPWHGIGASLEVGSTPEQFLKAAKLDWSVDLKPLMCDLGTEMIPVPNKFALVRSSDNKIMTLASENWNPLQNSDTLDFMRRYCEAGGAVMETAGGLRDGSVVWALARLNHSFEVRPGDKVEGYLLFTSPHVVGQAITIRTTTVRVVCANTMAMAERGGKVDYRQSHLNAFDVNAAHAAVEGAHEQLRQAESRAKILDQLKISMEDAVRSVVVPVFAQDLLAEDPDVIKFLMKPGNMPKNVAEIIHSIDNAPGAIADSGWGVLNGITHWVDHVAGNSSETRLARAWTGDYARKKLQSEQILLDMAEAA